MYNHGFGAVALAALAAPHQKQNINKIFMKAGMNSVSDAAPSLFKKAPRVTG
jgi:hypothetical protein